MNEVCDQCNEVTVCPSWSAPNSHVGQWSTVLLRRVRAEMEFEQITNSPRYPQNNRQAEQAIVMVKNLVKKAMEYGSDIQLVLLNFTNTVRIGYSASLAQLLFGHRCQTLIPIQWSRLSAKLAADVYRDTKIAKDADVAQYNKSAHHLKHLPLDVGPVSDTLLHTEMRMPMLELPLSEEPVPMQDTPPPRVDSMSMHRGTSTRKLPAYLADYK